MLAIKGSDGQWKDWHVGDGALPTVHGAVVTIQVDGHELAWIYDAIKAGKKDADAAYYKDVWGV